MGAWEEGREGGEGEKRKQTRAEIGSSDVEPTALKKHAIRHMRMVGKLVRCYRMTLSELIFRSSIPMSFPNSEY